MKLWFGLVPLVCVMMGAPRVAFAQGDPLARFQLGPLSLTPKLTIQNLGVDSNVFNTAVAPVKDVTATIIPGLDATLRIGAVLITSKTVAELIYYQKAASERSVNLGEDVRLDVTLARMTPRLNGFYLQTRRRPNDEVDQRVQQKNVGAGIGVTIPAGGRFTFDFDARRTRYDYAQGEFGDPEVAEALNRDSDLAGLITSIKLTPVTSFALKTEVIVDRFAYTTTRDSDSLRIMPGLTFEPFALLSGSAYVGARRFITPSPTVPDFTGLVANVELRYTAPDAFRVTGQFLRDVDYSLDLDESFYVSTSLGVEVRQIIKLDWDVVGRARRARLDYQAAPPNAGRTDRMHLLGVGLGRRVGDQFRIGVDVDYVQRTSVLVANTYEGFRAGGSFTYGY